MRIALLAVPVIVSFYWLLDDSGLYRVLAEWQVRHFRSYGMVSTFLATWAILMIGLAIPFVLLQRLWRASEDRMAMAPSLVRQEEEKGAARVAREAGRVNRFILEHPLLLAAYFLILFGSMMGFYYLLAPGRDVADRAFGRFMLAVALSLTLTLGFVCWLRKSRGGR